MNAGAYSNPAQAALALRRALAQDPGNPTFTKGLMDLYVQEGRYQEAIALGEHARAAGSGDEALLGFLCAARAALGHTEALLACLRCRAQEAAAALEEKRRGADEVLSALTRDPDTLKVLAHAMAKLGLVDELKRL